MDQLIHNVLKVLKGADAILGEKVAPHIQTEWFIQLIYNEKALDARIDSLERQHDERFNGLFKQLDREIKHLLIRFSSDFHSENFITQASVEEIEGHHLHDVEERAKLMRELRREQIEKNYHAVPQNSRMVNASTIEDEMINSFMPAGDPKELTDEVIQEGRSGFREWLQRSKIIQEHYATLLDNQTVFWTSIRRAEYLTRMPVQRVFKLTQLLNFFPPLHEICEKMQFIPKEVKRVPAYKMEPILTSITVDLPPEGILNTYIDKLPFFRCLWVLQFLRTAFWFVPYNDPHFMAVFEVLQDRLAFLIRGKQTQEDLGDVGFGVVCDPRAEFEDRRYYVNVFLKRWVAATLRGIWKKKIEMIYFSPQEECAEVDIRRIQGLHTFVTFMAETRKPDEKQLKNYQYLIRCMYMTFGSKALHALNHPNPDFRVEFMVPDQIGGVVDRYIVMLLHQDLSKAVEACKKLAFPLVFVIYMTVIHIYLSQLRNVVCLFSDYVFFAAQGDEIKKVMAADDKQPPVFAQISNRICLIYRKRIMYHDDIFTLIVRFFEIIARYHGAQIGHQKIAEILLYLKIPTDKETHRNEWLNLALSSS